MTDRDEDQLRQLLRSAVPDAPDPGGWATAARRRATRRRATTAGVAAVVALALAVPLGMRTLSPEPVEPSPPLTKPACWNSLDDVDLTSGRRSWAPRVVPHVISARFCSGSAVVDSIGGEKFAAQPDLRIAADTYALADDQGFARRCDEPTGPEFTAALQLEDGSQIDLRGELGACTRLTSAAVTADSVGPVSITTGAIELYDELLVSAGVRSSTESRLPSCAGTIEEPAAGSPLRIDLPVAERGVVAAVECVSLESLGTVRAELDSVEWAALLPDVQDGLRNGPAARTDCRATDGPTYTLWLVDVDDLRYGMSVDTGQCNRIIRSTSNLSRGTAAPSVVEALQRLAGG